MILSVCISYGLWRKQEKQQKGYLLDALRAIRQNNVAIKYENYIKTTVSYIVHVSIYVSGPLPKNSPILLSDIDLY